MTTLINFLGSPGVGKTTLCAKVFAALKGNFMEAEWSPEYVKGWSWEQRTISPFDQYYIFGKECHNQSRLFNKVDVLLSDSPVCLTAFYQYFYNRKNTLSVPCHDFYDTATKDFGVNVISFFLPRKKEYNPNGRYQTQEESDLVSAMLKTWLNEEGFGYYELSCEDEDRLDEVMKILEKENVL